MKLLLSLLCAVMLSACAATTDIVIEQPSSSSPQTAHNAAVATHTTADTPTDAKKEAQQASAWAVSVDITPPPGMPMGGYSVMANKGIGFRTRLKARVIYLQDKDGDATALIQTDLAGSSLLVHHMVAQRVAEQTGLAPKDIVITASHSHSAPVNFYDNDFYNKHMSSGQWLEPAFLEFVTQRITDGILEAYQQRRPARIATGKRDIYGYNRNRSLDAYVLNDNAGDIDLEDPKAKFNAVNPSLYMIRIDVADDDGRFLPLAAFSSFSVHATALSVPVEVYNADLFAYAQKDLEWSIARRHQTPWPVVHGLTTGTQGDMAPALPEHGDNTFGHHPVDWQAARQLGQGIGKEAITLFDSLAPELTADVDLATAAREINIRDNNRVGEVELCDEAAVGNPVAAGAYERRTPWLAAVPFLKGGNVMSRRWWLDEGCQGNKRHLGFSFLQPLLEPKDSFPNTVLFQIIKVNDMAVLPLPYEVTQEAGRRMATAVSEVFAAAGQPLKYTWVSSISNGYFGYTTTHEEYQRQNYEGGHTLYGQYSTPYITAQLGRLASDFVGQGAFQELLPEWRYQLNINSFLPEAVESQGARQWLTTAEPQINDTPDEHYMAVEWLDVAADKIAWHQPLVRVEVEQQGKWVPLTTHEQPINDDGYDIEVRWLDDADEGMGEYQARWYNFEKIQSVPSERYRFVISERNGRPELASEPFVLPGDTMVQPTASY